jgi:hypothetical protein
MGRSRDWRRAQRERVIARTTRRMKDSGWFYPRYELWDADEARARICRAATTPHPCSRHCCGNPRRWFDGVERLTMQERRAPRPQD